jgi:hypothetical protein
MTAALRSTDAACKQWGIRIKETDLLPISDVLGGRLWGCPHDELILYSADAVSQSTSIGSDGSFAHSLIEAS